MSEAAGFGPVDCDDDDAETKIKVSGDDNSRTEHHHHYDKPPTNDNFTRLWLSALAAALATGLIAYLLVRDGDPPAVPPDDSRNWYNFDVEVEPGGAIGD